MTPVRADVDPLALAYSVHACQSCMHALFAAHHLHTRIIPLLGLERKVQSWSELR